MTSAVIGGNQTALCRYFAANGSCMYGDECQFSHDLGTSQVRYANSAQNGGRDAANGDQYFNATFVAGAEDNPVNMQGRMPVTGGRLLPNQGNMVTSGVRFMEPAIDLQFASMTLEQGRSPVNPAAVEFIPRTSTGLTHSTSTPTLPAYHVAAVTSVGSPAISPGQSPLMARRNRSPVPQLNTGNPIQQEYVGGTTYFYTHTGDNSPQQAKVAFPSYSVYDSVPPHIAHMKIRPNMPSFFMPDELKMELLNKQAITHTTVDGDSGCPAEVDNYHQLCPLEGINSVHKSNTFGFPTMCYKAINVKDGLIYCLRRIIGFRLGSSKGGMAVIDMWKKIQHSNIITLREVFTTKAFGDSSMVFVYDYHAQAQTLMAVHFHNANPHMHNGYSNPYNLDGQARPFSAGKGVSGPRQNAGLLQESLIWSYVVQLSSALRTIHTNGLACRAMDPTKILVTDKSRLRLNCVGIFDILSYDANQATPHTLMPLYQQEDLVSLGKVVLALACNSVIGIQREHMQTSIELVARNYSADLKNLIMYLLSNPNRARNINDIMPMIGARFYTQLDAAQLRNDVLENELSKEVEAGRLFRLMTKLSMINDRPEFSMDPSWSETGDRYMLKLYRDYIFHQVDETGAPWIDIAHVVHSLNKLEAGTPEKLCLMSRDEQSIFVVTYAELKRCFDTAFTELIGASQDSGLT